jgi:hypothetical protein
VVAGGAADVVQVVVLAAGADALLLLVARRRSRWALPVKTSLNWFMPALANMSVGSLAGTSGRAGHLFVAARREIVEVVRRIFFEGRSEVTWTEE